MSKQIQEIKEETKRDFEQIKNWLRNPVLLKWVKGNTAEGLQEQQRIENLSIEKTDNSLVFMDASNVKMLVTDAKYTGKRYAVYSLEQIRDIINYVGIEGRLIISDKQDNPCYLQDEQGNNIVVLAPRVDSD